jgi:hypothetical protein
VTWDGATSSHRNGGGRVVAVCGVMWHCCHVFVKMEGGMSGGGCMWGDVALLPRHRRRNGGVRGHMWGDVLPHRRSVVIHNLEYKIVISRFKKEKKTCLGRRLLFLLSLNLRCSLIKCWLSMVVVGDVGIHSRSVDNN